MPLSGEASPELGRHFMGMGVKWRWKMVGKKTYVDSS